MKSPLFLVIICSLLIIQISHSQPCTPAVSGASMSINNVEAYFLNGGDMWWDFNSARYEVPAGSGKSPFFSNSLWLTGIDESDSLHCAAVRYRQVGNDYWPGPIFTDGEGNNFTNCSPFDRHWSVQKSDIDAFLPGQAPTGAIEQWPAKGNPNLSFPLNQSVAPFVDVNGDGIYVPDSGDYPSIKGDQAVFWVMNDIGNLHTESGGRQIGVEIHVMAYAYQANNVVNNTTFYDYKIINKSSENYHDFGLGFFTDGDLGNPTDDFVGCDSTRNLGYFFNGDPDDEDAGFALGYGTNLPVAGIRMVRLPKDASEKEVRMTNFGFNSNISGPTGDPNTAQDYFNYMNGLWRDGVHWTIGGNGYDPNNANAVKTNYMFPGNPSDTSAWSECTNGNTPGDRRMIQSHSGFDFNAGSELNFTMAAIFSREEAYDGTCVDMTPFFEETDTVQAWADERLCENFEVELDAKITNAKDDDGAIDLIVKGSISGLTFEWSNGVSTEDLQGLVVGTYGITVTNVNGCMETGTFEVQPYLGVSESRQISQLEVFPNPSQNGHFTVSTPKGSQKEFTVFDLLGSRVISFTGQEQTIDLSMLTNGTYILQSNYDGAISINRIMISK